MIEVTSVKAPGWQQVVKELNTQFPDDQTFLRRLVQVMAQVSAARQAVLYLPDPATGEGDEPEPRPQAAWPATDANLDDPGVIESAQEARQAARAALASGQSRAFGLGEQSQYYEAGAGQGYVLAVPVGVQAGRATAAVTLLIEPRSRDAVRSTLAMAELLAGYVHGHVARQALRRTQHASFSLDLATRLIAAINTAPNFKGACMQLVNDVARQFGVDRVALGWVKGDTVKLRAISDTEHFDRRMAMVQRLEAAMEECLDQEQPVLYPQPEEQEDVLLAHAIVHAHRELAAGDSRLRVCSLPLRMDDEVVGILTIETSVQPGAAADPKTGQAADTPVRIDLGTVEMIQAALDLIAPVLRIRRSDDRFLVTRAWDWSVRTAGWAVGPKHTVWKMAGLAVMIAALFVTFFHTTYRVNAEATIQPSVKRIVSAPFDGLILRLGEGIEPGAVVGEGDELLAFDTTELLLSVQDAQGKILQAEKQAAAARREGKTAEAQRFEAQAERARAELAIYQHRIDRASVRSPIAGMIITGDLRDRVGATVRLGDPLLEVAPLDDTIVVVRVDERDISLIDVGTRGTVAPKSRPAERFPFEVERIVPLAKAEEGKNVFEVRTRLLESAEWMRPGMEGLARVEVGEHSLLYIGTRRIVDTLRLWLW